jgi:hypothetical protein
MQRGLRGIEPIGIKRCTPFLRQGLLIHEDSERSPDRPRVGACRAPPDDATSNHKLHLPCAVALERDDPGAQCGREKRAEKPAAGKTPIAGIKDMGGEVVRLPESADQCGEHAPRDTARDGGDFSVSLHGYGATDDVLLPQIPCITEWVCIPLGPDPFRPRRVHTVNNALILSRRYKDYHISSPHLFDTAGDETDPIARPQQRAHAPAPAEDRVPLFLTQSGHAIFRRGPGPISPQRVCVNCFPFSYRRPRPLDPGPFQCIPKNSPGD